MVQEAVEENESIQKNLKKLQLQLKQLKALHASAGIVVNPSDGAVVADVSFDQTPQVQQMKEEILALHSANADLEAKYARAVQEFEALRAQASGDAAGDPTRALLQALTQELQHYKDAVFRMQAEVESTHLKFLELKQREPRALEAGGAAAEDERNLSTARFKPDRGFSGADGRGAAPAASGGPRTKPVEFEMDDDPFGLDKFMTEVKTGKAAVDNIGSRGAMHAAGGGSGEGFQAGGNRRIEFQK